MKFDRLYIAALREVAALSTCAKHKVGAILVRDGRIISTGYNGAPANMPHCCDMPAFKSSTAFSDDNIRSFHREWSAQNEVHAEVNCIGYALRMHTDITGAELWLSLPPCNACAKLIIAAGIQKIVYISDATTTGTSAGLLHSCGIEFKQYIGD